MKFVPVAKNFKAKFYTHVTRSYLRQITEFYVISLQMDKVMPY